MSDIHDSSPQQEGCPAGHWSKSTILVVEDNDITRKLFRVTLEMAGYQVLAASDGESAFKLASDRTPDLVLLDLVLPDTTGFDLVRRLRTLPGMQAVPIVAVTGYQPERVQGELMQSGITDFQFKPVEPSRLVDMVRAYLPAISSGAGEKQDQGQGKMIVLADDDPIQLKLSTMILQSHGYTVLPAKDGAKALKTVARLKPDAVVTDVLMPQLDGFRLCHAIKSNPDLARIPVILVTNSFLEEADRRMAHAMGAEALLVRSSDLQVLLGTLVHTLAVGTSSATPSAEPISLDSYAERLCQQLDRHASLNAHLARRVAIRDAELGILCQLTDAVRTELSLAEVLSRTLYQCLDAAGLSLGAIYFFGPDGSVSLQAEVGWPDIMKEELTSFFGHTEHLFRATSLDTTLVVSDMLKLNMRFSANSKTALTNLIIAPVRSGEEEIGALVLGSQSSGLGEDWLAFAKALGHQFGIVIASVRTLANLRAAERKNQELIESLDGIVWEADPQTFHVSYVSPQTERMLGYAIERWLNQEVAWENLIHPDDYGPMMTTSRQMVAAGRNHALEYRVRKADGQYCWVRDLVTVIMEEGRPTKLRGILVDITERKQLEEQFQQAQKLEAVGRLAGGVAHDFNNLLTVINGYSQLLLSETSTESPNRKELEQIRKAGERSARLTQQLLAFSRKQTVQFQVLDLNKVVTNLESMLKRLIGEDVTLVTKLKPALGRINADPGQLEQVLMNLAVNARDAMPSGGTLAIETADVKLDEKVTGLLWELEIGSYVVLSVSDTGCGMDAPTKARIFEPFFTTKESGKGTGLGLATVYGIVKQHKGALSVYSEVGRGTTFKIYVPRVDAPAAVADWADDEGESSTGSETILLVEDSDMLLDLARHSLERRGYTVMEASSGEEALQMAERHAGPIHLVLTDVVMPGMNGRQLVEQLAKRRPGMKVLYMTGYSEGVLTHHGIMDPSVNLLPKPFTPTILLRKVREVLSRDPSGAIS